MKKIQIVNLSKQAIIWLINAGNSSLWNCTHDFNNLTELMQRKKHTDTHLLVLIFNTWLWRLPLQVVAKKYRGFDIPKEMTAIWKYLNIAYTREEFTNTCPSDKEIEIAYADVAKRLVK